MNFFQPLLLVLLTVTVSPAMAGWCPSFSIGVQEDRCNSIVEFNEGFQQIYLALMYLEQKQSETGNGGIANAPLAALAAANKESDLQGEYSNFNEQELVADYDDGTYQITKNNLNRVRNLQEEVSDMALAEQDRLLEDLQDFLQETSSMEDRELSMVYAKDCGTYQWCMQYKWCCIICRELQGTVDGNALEQLAIQEACPSDNAPAVGNAPPIVNACEYLANQELPGCLKGATIACEIH